MEITKKSTVDPATLEAAMRQAGGAYAREAKAGPLIGVSGAALRKWRHDCEGPPHVRLHGRVVAYEIKSLLEWAARHRAA